MTQHYTDAPALGPSPEPSREEGLLALAERVEALTHADKAVNRAVARAVGWGYQTPSEAKRKNPAWFHPDDCRDGKPVIDSLHGTDMWREPLNYLGSLDAAVKLVPEGAAWEIHRTIGGQFWADVSVSLGDAWWSDQGCTVAATPALALTAAALRALAASTPTEAK
jgi:hypothetical protein